MKKEIEYRKLHKINITYLKQEILSEDFGNNQNSTLELVTKYNSCLSKLLDKHAPQKKRTITMQAEQPWLNESLKLQKTNLCRLEQKWQKNHCEQDMKFLSRKGKPTLILLQLPNSHIFRT